MAQIVGRVAGDPRVSAGPVEIVAHVPARELREHQAVGVPVLLWDQFCDLIEQFRRDG